jgi:hypothetical protein
MNRARIRLCAVLLTAVLGSLAVTGCGSATSHTRNAAVTGAIALHGKPQIVDPVAGVQPSAGASATAASSAGGVSTTGEVSVAASSGSDSNLAKPVSNAQIEQELSASGISANPDKATLTSNGLAIPPANAPSAVVAAIDAGNQIAHLPYIWGGGHGTYEDSGYDCSGSLSFILSAAGLMDGTETSGTFMSFGDPGVGHWITVYAMNGHTFAVIAGLRFDTVALAETGTRWSNRPPDEPNIASFVARHPAGL